MPKKKQKPVSKVIKALTGIVGFDEITQGGLPRGQVTLLMGDTGSGKTVFAIQSLVNAARDMGEPGIFVAFEENSRQLRINAASFSWRMSALTEAQLFIFDARVSPDVVRAGGFDVVGMLAGLKDKAAAMGATRIVFDSVDVLLTLLDDPMAVRREVYRICDWLVENALTGILTMKLDPLDPRLSGYGFMEFRSDCVVVLTRRLVNRFSLRELQVVKYRGSTHSEDKTPFVILADGIAVASNNPLELDRKASTARVSTGVLQLDSILSGGIYLGSSTLITGSPGTGKSILCGAFSEAACRRGDRMLYVAFDENSAEIERNLGSVNVHIGEYRRSGRLQVFSARTEEVSAQVHLMRIKALINEFQPRCLVIDPISALVRAGGEETAETAVERLLYLTRARGITTICTSIVEDKGELLAAGPIYIGTLSDTWIHLSYFIQGGERNRSLSLVKSRGMKHSNQIRELVLSDAGIRLTDVYVSHGDVLMGSLRRDRQKLEQAELMRAQAEIAKARREVELAKAELQAQTNTLRWQHEIKQAKLDVLMAAEEELASRWEGESAGPGGESGTGESGAGLAGIGESGGAGAKGSLTKGKKRRRSARGKEGGKS